MNCFQDYISLFKDLHYLIQIGEGNSEIANKIRGKMDPMWFKLDDHEKEELKHMVIELDKHS